MELPNDRKRYEIHDGDLSVMPAPGTRHQELSVWTGPGRLPDTRRWVAMIRGDWPGRC